MTSQSARTKWGRVKFGGGRFSALAVAIPIGLILGIALGVLAVGLGVAGTDPVMGGIVFSLCLSAPTTALAYALMVDRDSLAGAAESPEDSVESGWYEQAAAGALTDIVALAGVTALILTYIPGDQSVDPSLLLIGVVGVAFASVGIRYFLARRSG